MRLLLRLDVTQTAAIPGGGPLVVIVNHVGWLDPVAVLGAFPRIVVPMAKREIFDWFIIGSIMKLYQAIPVNRTETDINAFKAALRLLKNNGAVLLAPEGTRSRDGRLQAGKDGAVMLALRSRAAIVPVGVTGSSQVEACWKRLGRAPIQLRVGEPFRLRVPASAGPVERQEIQAMTREMMYRLARQLPAEYRGIYPDPEQVEERYLIPLEI